LWSNVRNRATTTSAVTIRKSALFHIVFVWHASHKQNVISHNNNKRLVFIIDKNRFLCEARTEFFLYVLKNVNLKSVRWGGWSPSSLRRVLSLIPGKWLCDFWQTKWHCYRFFSDYFGFTLSLLFHRCSIIIFQSSSSNAI
jgi:hypothetical protein